MNGVDYDSCVGIKFRQFCRTSCYSNDYYNASTLYYCDIDNVLKPVVQVGYPGA
jgi:hypothetical protein